MTAVYHSIMFTESGARGGIAKPRDMPDRVAVLPYGATFTRAEFSVISRGLVPVALDDKWLGIMDGMTLRLHRSRTGHCIYAVEFSRARGGYRVKEATVNREPAEYLHTDCGYDSRMLHFIIRALMLRDRIPFPPAPQASLPQAGTNEGKFNATPRRPWWKIWG